MFTEVRTDFCSEVRTYLVAGRCASTTDTNSGYVSLLAPGTVAAYRVESRFSARLFVFRTGPEFRFEKSWSFPPSRTSSA